MWKKTDELVFTHDPRTRDASGMPERFAEELSPRKKKLHLPRNEKIQSWCESTGEKGTAKQEAKQE
jgi:hypothetical protein